MSRMSTLSQNGYGIQLLLRIMYTRDALPLALGVLSPRPFHKLEALGVLRPLPILELELKALSYSLATHYSRNFKFQPCEPLLPQLKTLLIEKS